MWRQKSLLEAKSLTEKEARVILDRAQNLKKLWQSWKGSAFPHHTLQGKTIVILFFEPSTRTRASFELAAKRLGAHVLSISPENSSVTKGETLFDTAKNLEAMDPDLLVLRHASAGAPFKLSQILKIPIINAGDGFHEHPTQALLDAFTIEQTKGSCKGLRILIVGDIAHSRVARSNIYLLKTLGAELLVCGPPTLIPPDIEKCGVEVYYNIQEALKKADVVMMLRVQFERQALTQFPTTSEYSKFWGLHADNARNLKKDAIVMHPGPLNEGVEISQDIASGPYSVILNQVQNGVVVRMALLELILGDPL